MPKHNYHDSQHEADDTHRERHPLPPASPDMNVTPLIDVLLVLLVIFMAALPLTQAGVDINLPLEVSTQQAPQDNTQVVAEYTADHKLLINKTAVPIDNLGAYFRDLFANRREKTLFINGDGSVRYGEIVTIVDAAVGASVKVAIVTDGMRQELKGKGGR